MDNSPKSGSKKIKKNDPPSKGRNLLAFSSLPNISAINFSKKSI